MPSNEALGDGRSSDRDAQTRNEGAKLGGVGRLQGAMAPLSSKVGKVFGRSKNEAEYSPQLVLANSSNLAEKKTFKPPPPVTSPPPPKREYVPLPPPQAVSTNKKQYFSKSRSIPSKQLVKPLPPRRTSESSQTQDAPNTNLLRLTYTNDQAIPPSLPPRRTSMPATPKWTSTALTIIETPPSLPARNYTLPNPPLPDRTYRQQPQPPPPIKSPPKKPQHLSVRALSVPTVQEEQERPSLNRIVSTSSAVSTTSAASLSSLGSSPSPILQSPLAAPKSPHIAELIKALESKKATQPLVPGSVRVPGMV